MKHNPGLIVGLDVGTSETKAVVAVVGEDGIPSIIAGSRAPSQGVRKGTVVHLEGAKKVVQRVLDDVEAMSGREMSAVHSAISGSHLQGFNNNGIVPLRHHEVRQHDIDKVLESAKGLVIPNEREILHVLPQEFIVDDQDGMTDPLGMSGVRLEARVHIVTGSISIARNLVKCVNQAGRTVVDLTSGAVASAAAVLSEEERHAGTAVIDIGGGTAELALVAQGTVRHSFVLPIGGSHLTNDLASGLRTPLTSAEDLKCRFGVAASRLVEVNHQVEVPSMGKRPPRLVSRSVVAELLEPRVRELLTLIQRELLRSELTRFLNAGIVLTGGTAKLEGIQTVAEEVFGVPVRIGTPGDKAGSLDGGTDASSATVVGLVYHAAQSASLHTQPQNTLNPLVRLVRGVEYWLSRHF